MRRSLIVAALALALAALAAATTAAAGDSHGKTLFRYVGQLKSTSGTSVTVTIQNGNRLALRSLVGQSQEQTFVTDDKTVFLKWENGIPKQIGIEDLAVNDYVAVNVRSARDSSLDEIKGTPAASIGDRGQTITRPTEPLYLFRGTLVAAEEGKVTIDVRGGNRKALRLMIGADARQTFDVDGQTVFLHWAKRIPTVIDWKGLTVGDRIVVRVRADRGSSLAEVEATAAKRVADREPRAREHDQNDQA